MGNSMFGVEYFLPMYFWTGAWFSLFTILMAASDMCCIVKHVTKFTEEIFSGLISAIFIVEAIKPTIKNFHATHPDGSPYYKQDSAFLQAFLTFGTYALATKLASLKNSTLVTPLISLTNYEMVEIEGGGVRKVPVKVVEQRVTNLMIHVLIGLSLVLASILKFVPKPVLLGVFLFMGVSSLNGNELFERLALWLRWDTSKYPKYGYVEKVKASSIHKFTFYQLICLGILYALKSIKAVAVVFPFFIASLVFIRWGFAKIFTAEELEALDGHGDEDDEVPCTEPESPLKRVQ